MKKVKIIFILFLHCVILSAEQQDNAVAPPRTPEQEALLQTKKMQQELDLSAAQSQAIYEINLRHARQRQTSTSRSEALKRVKNKDQELQRALSTSQYNRLQEKRYDENPTQVSASSIISGRTRTITNPQLIESGRVVSPTTRPIAVPRNATPTNDTRRAIPDRRVVSPTTDPIAVPRNATPTNESRRTIPEGTRYVPPRQTTTPANSRQETVSRPNTRSSAGSSSGRTSSSNSRSSSSGSSSSGTRR